MGSIAYKRFFSADVTHSFYKSGLSKDFSITPTAGTREKMRNQKLVFRPLPTGFKMYYRSVSKADATPFNPVPNGIYSFALLLDNKTEFLNVTELDESPANKYASGKIAYFRNTNTSTNAIAYELLNRLMPQRFRYDFTIPNVSDVLLKILDAGGNTIYLSPALLPDDNGVFHADVDLSTAGPGKYRLQQINNTTTVVAEEEIYADSTLAGKDVFGILDIELNVTGGFTFANFTALNAFALGLQRRASLWKYFIINKSGRVNFNSLTFTITDTRLDPVDTTVYGASPNLFDPQSTLFQFNGVSARTIISSAPLPFYETPQPNFRLDGNDTPAIVIEHLANPTRHLVSEEMPALVTDPDITQIFVFI